MLRFKPVFLLTLFLSQAFCFKFSPSAIQKILDDHNNLRSLVARNNYQARTGPEGPATNMQRIMWDSRIAKNAQRHANTLRSQMVHAPLNHKIGLTSESICPLAVLADLSDVNMINSLDRCIAMWIIELQTVGVTRNVDGRVTWTKPNRNALNMIHATTNRIGCGLSTAYYGYSFLVCQYRDHAVQNLGPGYLRGPTCTQCPAGTHCEMNMGLCECDAPGQGVCAPNLTSNYWVD